MSNMEIVRGLGKPMPVRGHSCLLLPSWPRLDLHFPLSSMTDLIPKFQLSEDVLFDNLIQLVVGVDQGHRESIRKGEVVHRDTE
jgi:hypothetical protein